MAAEMDQDTARHLFHEGAIFVFLDVPQGTEFGIDCNTWQVGEKFRGVKMIPPGVHFIYYSAVGMDGQVAPRSGFFYNFKKKEILVRKWDKSSEDMSDFRTTDEEQECFETRKEEMDKFLGVYPYDSYRKWISLTNHITNDVVHKLEPDSKQIRSCAQLVSESSNSQSRAAMSKTAPQAPPGGSKLQQAEASLPDMAVEPGSAVKFTPVPKRTYPEGASPAEISKYSMDHSYALQTLLSSHYPKEDSGLLGEVQFAFICFLLGQVYDGFEQWKKLVHLLCTCEEALDKNTALFDNFITLLHHHVKEIPEDFFVDIVSRDNFLTATLQEFFANVESGCTDQKLKQKAQKFIKHLEKKFKWDFTTEPDDYAPVIVE